jgi:hypothetical protein
MADVKKQSLHTMDSAWLTAERHPSFREAQFPLIALAHGVQTPNAVN